MALYRGARVSNVVLLVSSTRVMMMMTMIVTTFLCLSCGVRAFTTTTTTTTSSIRPLRSPFTNKALVSSPGDSSIGNTYNSPFASRRSTLLRVFSAGSTTAATTTTISSSSSSSRSISPPLRANLAVALDQPIFPFSLQQPRGSSVFAVLARWRRRLWSVLASDALKTATIFFVLTLGLSLVVARTLSYGDDDEDDDDRDLAARWMDVFRLVRGRALRVGSKLWRNVVRGTGVGGGGGGRPMEFPLEGGWGVGTLAGKRSVGDSRYVRYDFTLPQSNDVLSMMALGQQLDLCCLGDDGDVARGGFYLYSDRHAKGRMSILAPSATSTSRSRVRHELGPQRAAFAHVLDTELAIGDEIALRPGNNTLSYRGPSLPVTDMVYVTSGLGIVPILHQIKAILPSGSSSVKMVTVLWANADNRDFDVGFMELEKEYYKYNTKLEVSCVIMSDDNGDDGDDNDTSYSFDGNDEAEDAVPDFQPGTMAVVSGPESFVQKASQYLQSRQYPEECLCLLP